MEAKPRLGVGRSERQPKPGQESTRELLQDTAYRTLKRLIVSGEYEPGTRLSERQLASELKMSSSPVKSGLQRLQLEGLITVSPQRGIVVRELTIHEVNDLIDMRVPDGLLRRPVWEYNRDLFTQL